MARDSDKAIELSGMVSALTVVRVLTTDLDAIGKALDQKIARSPGLFQGSPLVIDLSALEQTETDPEHASSKQQGLEPKLAAILALLRKRGLQPVGVRAESADRLQEAAGLGLGCFDGERADVRRGAARDTKEAEERRSGGERRTQAGDSVQAALMLTQPVRAGQIIYAEHRDVVALAAVNPGAELIADGNVHVYATLRGRALAGARGDEQARIFCQKLEADLISIAGVYMSSEELPEDKRGKAVQIQLQNGELVITDLAPR